MPEAVRRTLVEDWNEAGEPAAPRVHALIGARASPTPGAAAVEHAGRSLTFSAPHARGTAPAAVLDRRALSPLGELDDIYDVSEEGLDRLLGEISAFPVNP